MERFASVSSNPDYLYNRPNLEDLPHNLQEALSKRQNKLDPVYLSYIYSAKILQALKLEPERMIDLEAFSGVPSLYVQFELGAIDGCDRWGCGIRNFLEDLEQAAIPEDTTIDNIKNDIKKSGLFFIDKPHQAKDNLTLLHEAAANSKIIEVMYLTELGANVNAQDGQGATALNKAVCTFLKYHNTWQMTFKKMNLIKKNIKNILTISYRHCG